MWRRTSQIDLKEHDYRLSALFESGGFSAYLKGELAKKDSGGFAYQPIPFTQFNNPGAPGATNIPYVVKYDTPTASIDRAFNTALELKYETAGGLVFRSLSGYQNKRFFALYDLDGTSLLGPVGKPQTQDQTVRERVYTQEFNVISPTTGAFNYVLGGYYQHNLIDVLLNINGTAPFTIIPTIGTNKTNYAAFAQGNYNISDQFEIQAGVRYNHFKVEGTGAVFGTGIGTFGPPPNPITITLAPQTGTYSDEAVTGKLAFNYKPDGNNLIYAFVARGYKPGGLNPPGRTFNKETVTDYEIGWKSSFLDRKIRTQTGCIL